MTFIWAKFAGLSVEFITNPTTALDDMCGIQQLLHLSQSFVFGKLARSSPVLPYCNFSVFSVISLLSFYRFILSLLPVSAG